MASARSRSVITVEPVRIFQLGRERLGRLLSPPVGRFFPLTVKSFSSLCTFRRLIIAFSVNFINFTASLLKQCSHLLKSYVSIAEKPPLSTAQPRAAIGSKEHYCSCQRLTLSALHWRVSLVKQEGDVNQQLFAWRLEDYTLSLEAGSNHPIHKLAHSQTTQVCELRLENHLKLVPIRASHQYMKQRF